MNETLEAMPTPTTPPSRSPAYGKLQLRLSSGLQQGRLVELTARKCSIGSAPQCTLRLRAAGIQPVHCLIDRSGEATIVRRHAGESHLNGQPLEHSVLAAGDRLQIGPLEFEVVFDQKPDRSLAMAPAASIAAPETQVVPENAAAAETPPPESLTTPSEPAATSDAKLTDQFRQLDARFEDLEQRLTELGRTLSPASAPSASVTEVASAENQRDTLADQVVDTLRPQLGHEIAVRVTAEVGDQIHTQLGPKLAEATAQLPTQLHGQLHSQLFSELSQELSVQLFSQLSTQLSAAAASRIDEELSQRLASAMIESNQAVSTQLSGQLAERLASQLPAEVRRQVDDGLAAAANDLGTRLTGQVGAAAAEIRAQLASQLADDVTQRVLPDVLTRLDTRSAELVGQVASEVLPGVADQVQTQLTSRLDQQFEQRTARLEAKLSQQLTAEISQQVSEDLAPRLTSDVARRVAADVAPRVAAEVAAELGDRLSTQLAKETASRVAADVMPQVVAEVTARTGPELVSRLTSEITEQVVSQVNPRLEANEAGWEATKANWDVRQQEIEAGLADYCARLDERLESIAQLEQRLQSASLEHEQQSSPAEADDRIEQIQQALAELRSQHAEWVQQREQWRQTLAEVRHELEERAEKTRLHLSRMEARWEVFEREQRHRQADHETSTSEQIAQRLAGIRAEREAFESERHHDRASHHPGEHARQLDERLADLHGRRGMRDRQSHWPEQLSQGDEAVEIESTEPATQSAEPAAHHQPIVTAVEPESLEAPAPQEQPAVLELIHLAVHDHEAATEVSEDAPLARDESDEPDEPDEPENQLDEPPPQVADESYDEPPRGAHPSNAAVSESPAASGEEDEESIEAYMARLMQRVKTISSESPTAQPSAAPPAGEAPAARHPLRRAADTLLDTQQERTEEPTVTPITDLSELSPRSMPAERSSNISAMRDLANLSARSAIDTHQRKRMTGVIYSKLAVSIAALVAAVALAWMSNERDPISYAAALVAMVAGVVWGLQYLLLTGSRLFQSSSTASETPVESETAAE